MYSLSGRWKERDPGDSVPGVGAYSPRYETSGARQISLNGCGRDSNQKGTDTPGPAEYQSISESQARGPKFSLSGRDWPKDRTDEVPGAGAYSPDFAKI